MPAIIRDAGIFFLIAGLVIGVIVVRTLKDNLRPSLKPKVGGKLITTGLYSIVRHPAYGTILISAFGLSLWAGDGARLVLSACLLLFFDSESRMEEKWLEKTYPEYDEYKRRVTKKFIPWVNEYFEFVNICDIRHSPHYSGQLSRVALFVCLELAYGLEYAS